MTSPDVLSKIGLKIKYPNNICVKVPKRKTIPTISKFFLFTINNIRYNNADIPKKNKYKNSIL